MKLTIDEATKKQPPSIRYATLAIIIATLALIVGGIKVLGWAYQGEDVIQVKEPIPIVQNVVKDGGTVTLQFDYCKTTSAYGVIERDLVSKTSSHDFPDAIDPTGKTCGYLESNIVLPALPIHAIPDTYWIEYTITYDLNPLKTKVVDKFRTEEFRVE